MEVNVQRLNSALLAVFVFLTVICTPSFANNSCVSNSPITNLAAEKIQFKNTSPLCIGVLAYRGKAQAVQRWSETAQYLSNKIGRVFQIVPLNLEEMTTAINAGKIHFTLTNPGNYVSLEAQFGASRIATMQTVEQGRTRVRFGAVIFTRADNFNITELKDLQGKSFMAVSPVAFGGFQMAWRELADHGIDPFNDISELKFAGFPQDNIIHAVLNREVDAATVRAETLMRMVESGLVQLNDLRILNSQHNVDSSLPLSTRLYPEWPFATLKNTPRKLATRVAQALLSMPMEHIAARQSRTAGWTGPLDYSPVHRLMKTLKIGPYEVLRQTTLISILKRYAPWFIAAAALILLLLIVNRHISKTNHKLKHTQSVLREEIAERKRSQQALARYRDSLEDQVTERTEDLKKTNQALEKSRIALRELVRITSAPDLSHEEKLSRLLDCGREYFNLPVAVLSSTQNEQRRICRVSGDTSLADTRGGPLSKVCVNQLQECHGEPLDIPDLEHQQTVSCDCQQQGWKTYLGVAVMVEGKIHCSLEFAGVTSRDHQYSRWDHELLKVMAQWIGDEVELQTAHELQQRHQSEYARVSRMSTIGEMAASLAHELNQPLTAAINYCNGCLRMLQSGDNDRVKISQGMVNAVEGATLAADIIKRIRVFLQKGDVQHAILDLNQTVRNVDMLVKHEAQRHEVRINLHLADNLPPVSGDMIQLEQVVLNFIRNGLDAMVGLSSAKRNLTISTCVTDEGKVRLSAIDNGVGIAEEAIAQIFDAFYTTKSDGMGIGLSVSRSIIESHQGLIKAHSIVEGGTEFIFELPVAELA